MKLLELTFDSAAHNLAIDEALLETAELGDLDSEVLRIWEPRDHFVVIGRSSPFASEVNHSFCTKNDIPVLRRASGGASIVTGPGCLMYAVLLDYRRRPQLRMLDAAHEFVMSQMAAAVASRNIQVQLQGTSDLTLGDQKISGNSLRCKRNWMLYHGTMICESFDMQMISNCLGTPRRQPEYRKGRDHDSFLTKLPTDTAALNSAIINQWPTDGELIDWPQALTEELVQSKYLTRHWNEKV